MTSKLQNLIKTLETSISENPKNNMMRVSAALDFFEIDFRNVKKIHVAGTNGKGSTCKFITEILTEAGYHVGTFVSPYLRVFNERILLNNELINDFDLENYLEVVIKYNESLIEKMSFFELLTVMSLLYFYDMKVDVIVIEVGIGGKYDVTNTINYDLSLLTNVGTDHIDRLGPTESDILNNKLGILKAGSHMITTLDFKHRDYARNYADSLDAVISFVDKPIKTSNVPLSFTLDNHEYKLNMIGDYQLLNAALAIKAVSYLFPDINYLAVKVALERAKWPGRLDLINDNPKIFIDAAHNREAAIALREAVENLFPKANIITIMSILKGKDYHSFIFEVMKFSSKVILTPFSDPRLADLDLIKKEFPSIIRTKSFEEAISYIKDDQTIYLVTGSIHFIGFFLNNY